MKRISLMILLAAITLSGMAQAIGEAFYIYRNDGQFNAFFRDEVQAIEYSYYDADSVKYEEIVTQVVITADSVYKIPLAAIDSVGFVQPETVYRDDAKQIKGDLYDYLINVDDMMLTFSASTPSNILPIIGDKLVEVDETDKLPLGFLGQVESVTNNGSNIEVVCKKIELEEVVKTFYRTVGIVSDDTNNAPMLTRRAVKMDYSPIRFNIGKLHFPMSYAEVASEKDILGFKGKISGKLNNDLYITPKIIGKVTRAIDDILVLSYYNVQINTDVDFEDDFEFACEWTGSLKKPWVDDDFPTPVWGYPIYFAVGPVTDLSGELAMGVHLTGTLRVNTDITYYPATSLLTPILPAANLINRVSIIPSLENASASLPYFTASGSFKFGVFCRFGLPFPNHKVAWVGGEVETGAKIEANAKFDFDKLREADKSTLLYEEAVETMTLDVMPYWSLKFVASALDDKYKFEVGRDNSFWGLKFLEGSIIPKFSGTTFTRAGGNTAYASVDITNDCPFACKVGFSLFNENGTKVETKYCDKEYHTRMDFSAYGITFDNLDPTKKYKVYPCLNYGGYDILGLPSAELIPVTVEVTKMHISNIQYAKNAFTNDGEAYDFCYNAEITTELVNAEGVVDWGYVYEDPKRNIKRISLMGNQSPYTDTNYAFYRNEPKSEACLYGYIKYVGDDNYYYGEKKNYPLIYDKQPEATTLEPTYVDETSAKVKCGFKEVAPWGGICGIEYWEDTNDKDSKKIYFETAQEEIEVTLNDLKPGTIYYYQAFIKVDDEFIMAEEVKHFTTQSAMANLCPDDKHPHLIDLGLPSGTKWACCNVGASRPEDYGGYYDIGEAFEKDEYSWENYPYRDTDLGKNIAGTPYDVAHSLWGEKWTTPTKEQLQELIDNTTLEITTINGISGGRFISSNGTSIFLPAAGYKLAILYGENLDLRKEHLCKGERGAYWSATQYAHREGDTDSMWELYFNIESSDRNIDAANNFWGMPIRSVQSGISVITGDATEIKATTATLNGKVENYEKAEGNIKLAFLYSTSEDILNSLDGKTVEVTPDSEGNLTANILDLSDYTTYYYAAAYKLGDADYVLGEVKHFTTSSTTVQAITLEVVRNEMRRTTVNCKFTGLNGKSYICGLEYWGDDEERKEITDHLDEDGVYEFQMCELIPSNVYYCRAFVMSDGSYVKADNTITFEAAYNPNVRISDFKQNASYNIPGHFMEIGAGERQYDYRYFTQFTIHTGDLDNIESLGCLYKGPSGKFIDSYLYYNGLPSETGEVHFNNMVSNSAEESLVIIPCAMIDDGENNGRHWEFGKKMVFGLKHSGNFNGCSDNNHPHMIDLGLPSGTKWACCNVGAHAPEQSGGYYMWGETKEKSFYDWRTYDYANDWNDFVYIGSDISGTKHDVATVLWGAPWQMPTETQMKELFVVEDIMPVTINGVPGCYVVHFNGSSIFLPNAGHMEGADKIDGFNYRTSILDESNPVCSRNFYFSLTGGGGCYSYPRYGGFTVRPVRKE